MPSVQLQVAPAASADVGKGVARLSAAAMKALGLRGGEPIAITGKRTTAAIALPPYPEDADLDFIRLDGLGRVNAGVGVRDAVTVARADPKPARRVVLGPADPHMHLSGSGEGLRQTLLGRPLVAGDLVSTSIYHRLATDALPDDLFSTLLDRRAYGLQEIRLLAVATKPQGVVVITDTTEIVISSEHVDPAESRAADVTYDDVGGVRETIELVREMIELPLKHPELFHRLGIDPPKGVLLHGPPGTGKTLLARAVANESDAAFFSINGPEIVGSAIGQSEQQLRAVFEQARDAAPAIVFIDEIDSIAPKRAQVTGETEKRLVAQLLTLMDGLQPRQHVVVIGATNMPDALDEALRRPGRFDRELIIGVPDADGRREILDIHTRGMPLGDSVDLDGLARTTYGFVGADLAALCREAALETLRRNLPRIDLSKEEIPADVLDSLEVTGADFQRATKRVQPSALREILIQTPDVGWDDVGGLADVKRALREGVQLPLARPDAFRRLGIRPAKGFLLYGPPGTGKTLLAKAVAREAEANFIAARSSDLLSKWYGESEKQVARLFQRARQVAPTVVFFDELDALAPRRGGGLSEPQVTERVVNTLLAELDGLEEMQGVVVLAATNQPMLIDPALLRPGRFDELIYVPIPDRDTRLGILRIHTRNMPCAPDVDLEWIADETHGYTGADLEDLVRRAGLLALRHSLDVMDVPMPIFREALAQTRASVTPAMEAEYARVAEQLHREHATVRRIGFAPIDR
ncbi:MAG: AAA family ATPase [Deltaproteobacteria bacterium]|nr:MAG: AAA family ATPase [Deltaproteobacteria bacterium]